MSDNPRRPFREGPIEPICEAGENVLLAAREGYSLYQVGFIEPLPRSFAFQANIGAIAAGITAAAFNLQNLLDMNYGEMAQLRAQVLDDIRAVFYQPAGVARYATQNQFGNLNAQQAQSDPCAHTSEFFIFENQRPSIIATNPTGYALAQARIAFWGFKYVLLGRGGFSMGGHSEPLEKFATIDEARKRGFKFTYAPIGGWGR